MIKEKKIEFIFVELAIIFGLILVFLMPPLQMPDEEEHLKKIYCISDFQFRPKNIEGVLGNYIPQPIIDFTNKNGRLNIDSDPYTFKQQYLDDEWSNSSWEQAEFTPYYVANANGLMYIPQVIAIWLVKAIYCIPIFEGIGSMTPIHYMYAARLGNLLFFIITGALSLRIIPFFKKVLFGILMMPMTLALSASLGYDAMVIGVSFLVISVLMKILFEEYKLDQKAVIGITILAVILIQLKQVYFPIILIMLMMDNKIFSGLSNRFIKNKYSVFISISIIAIIGYVITSMLAGGVAPSSVEATGYPHQQVLYILQHPIQYIKILMDTFVQMRKFYLTTTVGVLGSLDTNFPYILIVIYVVYLVALSLTDSTTVELKLKHKLYFCSIAMISVLLIQTALYIIWTSLPEIGGVGHEIISGVQGRYYIPILILVLTIFYNRYITDRFKVIVKIMDIVQIPITIFYSAYTCITVLISYRV